MDEVRELMFPEWALRQNVQCFAGAVLGLVALFLPWLGVNHYSFSPPAGSLHQAALLGPSLNLFEVVLYAMGPVPLFCALFAVGTFIALVTPVGGVVQAFGLMGFIYGFALSDAAYRLALWERVAEAVSPNFFVYVEATMGLGTGYFLAILSTFLVLWSPSASVRSARKGPIVHSRVAALAWNTSYQR